MIAFEVADTGIGIPAGKAADHFRGVPAGGRGHQPQIRRHRVWAWRSAANWRTCSAAKFSCAARPDEGSTFTLYLPQTYVGPSTASGVAGTRTASAAARHSRLPRWSAERPDEQFRTTATTCSPDDAVLLIVEDDPHYARVLCDLARDKGFKVLVATRGAEALALAREFHPTAVSLDVFLPDMLGWTVLNHLKQDPTTRHIPVQMLTLDEDRHHGLARGAFSFVTKPTTPEGLEAAFARIKEYADAAAQAVAGGGGRSRPSNSASASCWATTTSTSPWCRPAEEALKRRSRESRSIAWCWICACRT